MSWLVWVGMVATVVRGTRLLVKDEFPPARGVREFFLDTFGRFDTKGALVGGQRWGGLGHSIAYVWTCWWCMSFWLAAIAWGVIVALGVSVSALVGTGFIAVAMLTAGAWGTLDELADQQYEINRLEIQKRKDDLG